MMTFPSAPPSHAALPQGHWPGFGEQAKINRLLPSQELNWLFSNPPKSSMHTSIAWRHSHPQVLSGIFILTSLNDASSLRAHEHLRSSLHLTNPCTKRKVLSLTKPKSKIYKTKSHGHYITHLWYSIIEWELSIKFFFLSSFLTMYELLLLPHYCQVQTDESLRVTGQDCTVDEARLFGHVLWLLVWSSSYCETLHCHATKHITHLQMWPVQYSKQSFFILSHIWKLKRKETVLRMFQTLTLWHLFWYSLCAPNIKSAVIKEQAFFFYWPSYPKNLMIMNYDY